MLHFPRRAILFSLLCCGAFWLCAEEAPKRPEHEVLLEEDETVELLLRRARESAAKGAEDPEAWPACVKAYMEILTKHANKVFLYRWAGDGGEDARPYGLGVYRSVAEKVTEEIAKLSPAGLAVYRAVCDPQARGLYAEAEERLDERQMESVAQTFFPSAWGDNAVQWLAEYAYGRGADRQALSRLQRIAGHPDADVSKLAVAVRALLAELRLGQKEEATAILKTVEELAQGAELKNLRVGHREGEAALTHLRERVSAVKGGAETAAQSTGWDTYFGDATHTRLAPERSAVGVRKWCLPIPRLLGAPEGHPASTAVTVRDFRTGQTRRVIPMNVHLSLRDGLLFITNGRIVACHSTSRPNPERPTFWWPPSARDLWPVTAQTQENRIRFQAQQQMGVVDQPFFVTLGEQHLYVTLGPPPQGPLPQWWGGRERPQQDPNWVVAVGKKPGGRLGIEGGSLLWSTEPGSDEPCRVNTKVDQDWLKGIYLVSTPTYAEGTLFTMGIEESNGPRTAWVLAMDAASGRLLWRTRICSGQAPQYGGGLQPALGLPIAVSGGQVYCVTNLGAVAALEAATGAIRWIRVYDRTPGLVIDPRTGNYPASDYWAANAPMLYDDVLIITPQDSNLIYGIDPQDGRRKWQSERVRNLGHGNDAERMEFVLGILHGRLVISGRGVAFIDAKGGKVEYATNPIEEGIVGRGVIAGENIFVPTEKGIVMIDGHLGKSGKPTWKLVGGKSEYQWADPKEEAGHLFADRDALFSVSATHANAYFIPDVIEKRLKKQLEEKPDELAAWLELGDLYHVQERFDDAVKTFDQGLARPSANKQDDEESKRLTAELKLRKYESFFAAGEKLLKEKKPADAYVQYTSALGASPDADCSVRALWKLSEAAQAKGDAVAAAGHLQVMLVEHGDVNFSFEPNSSCLASVFARRQLERIRKENPKALEQLDAKATDEIRKAIEGANVEALEKVLRQYPGSGAYVDGLLALIKLSLEKGDPLGARLHGLRFLSAGRSSPKLPDALACLVVAYEKTGMLGAAKQMLQRLASMTGSVSPPGEVASESAAWAAERLKRPEYVQPVSNAARELGNGRLVEMWSREESSATGVLVPAGVTPPNMLDQVLILHQNVELSVRSGRSGEELWLPRPKLPAGFQPNWAAWSQEMLVVAGQNEVLAFDTRRQGKLAWSFTFAGGEETLLTEEEAVQVAAQRGQMFLTVNEQLVAVALPNGSLVILDAASGLPLWTAKGQGRPLFGPPAVGHTFVAVGALYQQPMKVIVYDAMTGQIRYEMQPPGNQLAQPLMAQGDRLYLVCSDNRLHVYGDDGKQVWEYAFEAPTVYARVFPEMFVSVLANQQVVALNTEAVADDKRLLWRTVPESNGQCTGIIIDGTDALVAQRFEGQKGRLSAYHAGGGKLRWRVDTIGGEISAEEDLARGHLLLATPDPRTGSAQCVSLVDRRTGKLTWSQGVPMRSSAALFGGGVTVVGSGKLTGYVVAASDSVGTDLDALRKQVADKPGDLPLALRLAQVLHERKESREALQVLARFLASPGVTGDGFSQAYDRLRRLRAALARTDKPVVTFARVAAELKVDGDAAGWSALPAVKLDDWRSVHLAEDEDQRVPYQSDVWKGSDDLSVTFRGGCDATNLYLQFEVKDDRPSNPQEEGIEMWNGDSVQVAFDLEQNDGLGFEGEDFELGWALNDKGRLLAWRWTEHGKYIHKPLDLPVKVVRHEENKTTEYRAVIPLKYLGLKPDAGTRFGFTFMVNDRDDDKGVRKGMALTPGIWNPKFPGQYGTGELGK